MHVVAAQADFVVDALSNLGQEIVIGGILSIAIILLFLRDWRASLAIGIMVPLSVLLALVVLQALDVTVNVLSLGGLALGVGLLVDNAIVVAEAAGRKLEALGTLAAGDGRRVLTFAERLDAIIEATEEVAGPLIAGTLTTLLVFGPIVFVKGLAAALFRDLSLSVVTSVGASLILALTLMPVLMSGGSDRVPAAGQGGGAVGRWLDWLGHRATRWYEAGMRWSLRHPGTVVLASIGLVSITVYAALRLPREILPRVDEGIAVAYLQLPQGTAIERTVEEARRIGNAAT